MLRKFLFYFLMSLPLILAVGVSFIGSGMDWTIILRVALILIILHFYFKIVTGLFRQKRKDDIEEMFLKEFTKDGDEIEKVGEGVYKIITKEKESEEETK